MTTWSCAFIYIDFGSQLSELADFFLKTIFMSTSILTVLHVFTSIVYTLFVLLYLYGRLLFFVTFLFSWFFGFLWHYSTTINNVKLISYQLIVVLGI